LRHLRDRLVAAELWPLALEVSTKAGLERGGVWAAWGKACLRSGQLLEAREHLAHCLQTPLSAQDPSPAPLLMEIINILVESTYSSDAVKRPQYARAPALAVLHTLASLTDISQGKLVTPASDRPQFYQEIQYYLRTYGSPAATLSFFLSHSDVLSALLFVKERNIEPEIFAESLYKPCLRQGMIEQLHQEMRNIDPTLELWKVTIFIYE
jgi:zinc finger FYVE domain-containing protein 26